VPSVAEAIDMLLGALEGDRGVYRVWATCNVDNERSARLLERAGFTLEGRLRVFGEVMNAVRARVGEAVRRLAGLGFVDLVDDDQLRLRPALLRFAEPVRGLSEPAEALAQLVARGEIALEAEGAAAASDEGDGEPGEASEGEGDEPGLPDDSGSDGDDA